MPRWVWAGALAGLAAIVGAVLGGALMLALGAANLPTAGPLQQEMRPGPSGAGMWGAQALPALDAVTLEAEMAQLAGPEGAGYGLWLWHCDGRRQKVFAVESAGYVAWFAPGEAPAWVWFPHARPQANRLRIHIAAGRLTLYINEEAALTQAPAENILPLCAWGFYAGEGARAAVHRARVWHAANSD